MAIHVKNAERESKEPFDPIEEASRGSFPASDPPSWTATTVGPPSHDPAPTAPGTRAKRRRDALDDALEGLATAVTITQPGTPDGRERVAERLATLANAIERHAAEVEAPKGPLAKMDATRPSLLHRFK